MQESADVLIVGSGVSGALTAAKLAAKGVKVLVLEAGPRVNRSDALLKYYADLLKMPECPYPNAPYAAHSTTDQLDLHYVQKGPVKFGSTYLRQVGGTTWHWLGTAIRFVPDDFRLKSTFGVGLDWPLSYADLEPWYCQAERELGVAGDSAAPMGSPRSKPFPLQAIPLSYLDQRVAAVMAKTEYPVLPTPQARNSEPYQDRPVCCGNSMCIPMCPIQAKYDATVHLTLAERAGARLMPETIVSFVEVDGSGRVSGLRYKRPDGSEGRATAKVYVIAAHAIETPKLLLQSRTSGLPKGIANSSDQVGRNLMDHPTRISWGLASEPLYPFRGPLSTGGIESPRFGKWRNQYASFRIQLDNRGWEWPTDSPKGTVRPLIAQGLRGDALNRAIADHCARELNVVSMAEQLPSPDNRVEADEEHRDAIGLPRPRITYSVDDYTRTALDHGLRVHQLVFDGLKATSVTHGTDLWGAGHCIGTYRMGADPKTSVVNADCRTHDHPNLFLLGSGVFPTSAASNPTLTIAAVTLRAVGAMARALRD